VRTCLYGNAPWRIEVGNACRLSLAAVDSAVNGGAVECAGVPEVLLPWVLLERPEILNTDFTDTLSRYP